MENYDEMQDRIKAYDAERKSQYQTVQDALNQAVVELNQLIGERDTAAENGDVDLFVQKCRSADQGNGCNSDAGTASAC